MILAIDPGKFKCGLAVLDEDGKVREKEVVQRGALAEKVSSAISNQSVNTVVIGQGAFGREVAAELSRLFSSVNLIFIPETDSTRLARQRYWEENPPSGWLKIIPTSLRVPPVPIDDLAAVILGERYLKS